ncbi:MAG: translation initiation factor IF-2 [Ignavibacteria bacterium]|nr:translation initiation factor IF-2 [Ignavibacteria bacterium]
MAGNEKIPTRQKVFKLIREINRPKDDVIAYLNTLGLEKVTVNTNLEPEIVAKVITHFKKDIEGRGKHLKKVVEFATKNKVEISEAEVQKKKEEEEKIKREEEERLRKNIEENLRRQEEEKRKQELLAFLEREKVLKREQKEQEEKSKKEKLEKLYEKQKQQREREKEAKEQEARKLREREKTEEKKVHSLKHKKSETEKQISSKVKSDQKQWKEKKQGTEDLKKTESRFKKDTSLRTGKAKYFDKQQSDTKKEKFKSDQKEKHKDEKQISGKKSGQHLKKYPDRYDEKSSAKSDKTYDKAQESERKRTEKRGETGKFKKHKSKNVKISISDVNKGKKTDKDTESGSEGHTKVKVTFHGEGKVKDKKDKRIVDKKDKKKTETDYEKKRKSKLAKSKNREYSKEEIEDAIRETYQKMEEDAGISARSILRRKKKKERLEQEKIIAEVNEARKNILNVTEFLTTMELANLMNINASEIVSKFLQMGMMVTINQRLDRDLIQIIADEFKFKIEFQKEYQEEIIENDFDQPETLKFRPPVVTVMGHVDHGKTSLLDHIRKENVVAGEAGGITQHIGAYKVNLDGSKEITFLDTPGHEAFTAMRARGGQAADIVVLVVAADDSVMPQTVEAINHALAANVPIIVAINKIDKPDANSDRIRQQLSEKNILVEDWGGKYQSVEISAKFGKNIDTLLDKILLEAEVLDLKANPDRRAKGVILESKLDKGRGAMATLLVQKGMLRVGDVFLAGLYSGRVRAMFDERDRKIEIAGPSTPVQILGFDGLPQAGDVFAVLENESMARDIALKRQQLKREQDFRQIKFATLDDISRQIKEGKQVDLNIIIKADTDGSAEAISDSLMKLTTSETKLNVIHKAVGQISESDILLAEASNAIVIGFNVRPNLNARKLAEKNKIDIRIYNVIFKIIEEIKQALEGMLEPEISEEVTATVEIREIFKVPKIGNVAGCYVQDGKISRNNKVRLLREGLIIYDGAISSLKRLKDDVREVEAGYECGIGLENFNDIKVGDIIESFKLIETKKKLVFGTN